MPLPNHDMIPAMRAHKFLDKHFGLKSLYERRLKHSQIHELNDPFELAPYDLTELDESQLQASAGPERTLPHRFIPRRFRRNRIPVSCRLRSSLRVQSFQIQSVRTLPSLPAFEQQQSQNRKD
jgi:hypothetical protein